MAYSSSLSAIVGRPRRPEKLSAISRRTSEFPSFSGAARSKDSEREVQLLQDVTDLKVCEIEDKDPLTPGTVHVAPANYHVMIEDGHASLTIEEPVRFSRPSIDVMFSSAADTYGAAAIGVVLTGANEDGARGLAHIVKRGGLALVQDPKTAEIPIMPQAAIRDVRQPRSFMETLGPRLVALSRGGVRSPPGHA